MKRFIRISVCLLSVVLFLVSCEEQNTPTGEGRVVNSVDNPEYYVKYSINSSLYKFGSIYYADVYGTVSERTGNYSNTSKKWSVTIGPVKKNFSAHVRYNAGKADEVKIEVSKNGGPFVLKANGTIFASYTINY